MSTDQDKVEKILGEPFAMDFSDYIRKIRNGLIITSVISIVLILGNLEIDKESSFLGLKFNQIDNELILTIILSINAYLFVHFLWCSIDYFQEWWLRLTGIKKVNIAANGVGFGGGMPREGDYPDDPRQSTLYNWWKNEAGRISSLQESLVEIEGELKDCRTTFKSTLKTTDNRVNHAIQSIENVSKNIGVLKKSIENASSTCASERIPESLKRFDDHFRFYLKSQNLRWLVIELGLPLILGLMALYLLIEDLFC